MPTRGRTAVSRDRRAMSGLSLGSRPQPPGGRLARHVCRRWHTLLHLRVAAAELAGRNQDGPKRKCADSNRARPHRRATPPATAAPDPGGLASAPGDIDRLVPERRPNRSGPVGCVDVLARALVQRDRLPAQRQLAEDRLLADHEDVAVTTHPAPPPGRAVRDSCSEGVHLPPRSLIPNRRTRRSGE